MFETCRYQKAVELRPDLSVLSFNLAQALEAQQNARSKQHTIRTEVEEFQTSSDNGDAIEKLHFRALELDPNATASLCAIVLNRLYALNWQSRETLLRRIQRTDDGHCSNTFYAAATSPSAEHLITVARAEARKLHAQSLKLQSHRQWTRKQKRSAGSAQPLQVAVVSSDFGAHSVGSLLHRVFQHLSRDVVNVSCIATAPGDGTSMHLDFARTNRGGCDSFRTWSSNSDGGIAYPNAALFEDLSQANIVVDLNGLSHGHVGSVLVARPSTTLSYLGFPSSSSGLHDYFVTDAVVTPPDLYTSSNSAALREQAFEFEEHLLILARPYIVSSYTERDPRPEAKMFLQHPVRFFFDQNASGSPSEEALPHEQLRIARSNPHLRLPGDRFILCNFGQLYKVTPEVLDAWANILRQRRNALLWVLRHPSAGSTGPRNFVAEMNARGIASRRIVITDHVTLDDHLSLKTLGDLHLDTFPYNGHTTALDAIWAGVPHISLGGTSSPSRVGQSVLRGLHSTGDGYGAGKPRHSHVSSTGWRKQPLDAILGVHSLKEYECVSSTFAKLQSQPRRAFRQHITNLRHAPDGLFGIRAWVR